LESQELGTLSDAKSFLPALGAGSTASFHDMRWTRRVRHGASKAKDGKRIWGGAVMQDLQGLKRLSVNWTKHGANNK
jgi:hypothetical protein